MTDVNLKQKPVRPEQASGRSRRVMAAITGVTLMLANARRFDDMSSAAGMAAVAVVTVALVLLWNRKLEGGLRHMSTRAELSDAVSESKGARRAHLTWYEYAIAKNVARGTYDGEPPATFKNDVYDISMRMGLTTRASIRQIVWVFGALLVLFGGITVWASAGDWSMGVILLALFGGVMVFTAVVTAALMWWKSRGPFASLGRRIEVAGDLPSGPRWDALLQIASDELALQPSHS